MAHIFRRPSIRLGPIACVYCVAGVLLAAPVRADEDHDRVRGAVERGEVLPLAEILARVHPPLGGEVVGVSVEREDGRWVYEFRVIEPGGRLVEVEVDAATARVLKREED